MIEKHPKLQNNSKFYEMGVHEQQTELWKKIRYIDENIPELFTNSEVNKYPYFFWFNNMQGLLPGIGLHYTMFQAATSALSNEE